jgi:hypothetical protein
MKFREIKKRSASSDIKYFALYNTPSCEIWKANDVCSIFYDKMKDKFTSYSVSAKELKRNGWKEISEENAISFCPEIKNLLLTNYKTNITFKL